MPEKTVIPALNAGLLAAGLAGVMQISVVLVLALKMRPVQYLGSFLLSTITGGLLTVLLQEYAHWSPFLAGVFGAFSGALPAVVLPLIIMRLAFKRLGITDADLTQVFDAVQGMQHRTHPEPKKPGEEVKSDGPAQP